MANILFRTAATVLILSFFSGSAFAGSKSRKVVKKTMTKKQRQIAKALEKRRARHAEAMATRFTEKSRFDKEALDNAMVNSKTDQDKKSVSVKEYRKTRATASKNPKATKTTLKIAGQYRGVDLASDLSRRSSDGMLGLGERKGRLLQESTDIDFDSELREVEIDPESEKIK